MIQLRDYQLDITHRLHALWLTCKNVIVVLPTGAGKTSISSDVINDHIGASCVIAHRQELVGQLSLALAMNGVRHRIIAPHKVIRWIVQQHVIEVGQSYYDPSSMCAVAGVDTLMRRTSDLAAWMNQVTLWVIDECHHVVDGNKWGKCVTLFPNAKGLGVTATPLRADGKGLGRKYDGVFDEMIVGISMRELIDQGYLCDYRIYCPESDIALHEVAISKNTGEFVPQQLKKVVRESHIVGDVVKSYLKFAPGKQGVTFATDIETAKDLMNEYRDVGVKSEIITGKTLDHLRIDILKRFKNKIIQQIVNVDILGEGFDVPAIEVVSFARPTHSYGLYVQQFGRSLRVSEGKERAIIIDHVGNVIRHNGPPDVPRAWSLARRDKRASSKDTDIIPLKQCLNPDCAAPYEAIHKCCPHCGHINIIVSNAMPEFVAGDLTELDPVILAKMRGAVGKMNESPEAMRSRMTRGHAPNVVVNSVVKSHKTRQLAQQSLKESIAWWTGHQQLLQRENSEIYRRFYFKFGMDMLTAQTLGAKESLELSVNINNAIDQLVRKV